MAILFIKALECDESHDLSELSDGDECKIELTIDQTTTIKLPENSYHRIESRKRWIINRSFQFNSSVKVKLWDVEDWPLSDDFLGENIINSTPVHKASISFKDQDTFNYILWYEVFKSIEDAQKGHKISNYSIKDFFGRLGKGVLNDLHYKELVEDKTLYQCCETISLKDSIGFHAKQDGQKSNTNSIKKWIDQHCNPWGEESVIPISNTPEGNQYLESGLDGDQWKVVKDEKSYCMAGLQKLSRRTNTDYFFNHETMDWNWYQIMDPSFMYMLNYTAKQAKLEDGTIFPMTENEWETGSMPVQWRPFWGEYVTGWGRHLFDVGHVPVKVEMHPAHTIIREHTTANNLGRNDEMVPVNRAIVGMGLSGGFPDNVGSRWKDETGENPPEGISGFDTDDCWVTNLKKHPLKFKFFPPVKRPSQSAKLTFRIILCEYIQVRDWKKVDDFLELTQWDDPGEGGEKLGFRVWDQSKGLPLGLSQNSSSIFKT
jgi:hypothetical protein